MTTDAPTKMDNKVLDKKFSDMSEKPAKALTVNGKTLDTSTPQGKADLTKTIADSQSSGKIKMGPETISKVNPDGSLNPNFDTTIKALTLVSTGQATSLEQGKVMSRPGFWAGKNSAKAA